MTPRFLAGLALCAALTAGLAPPALAAAAAPADAEVSSSAGMRLQPTSTCPQAAVDELSRAIEFVRGRTWAAKPGEAPLTLAPDLTTCEVVLHIGHLSQAEVSALAAGAGPRLAIEFRKDWARPTRILLVLWVVFGGSGVVWVYRRYARG